MKRFRNLLLVTLPVVAVTLVLAEVALWIWFWIPDPRAIYREKLRPQNNFIPSVFNPNARFLTTSKEDLPGMDDSMRFSTNNLGFRGDSLIIPKPKNEFRIFLIGGSTAECFYLDDSKSIDRILQNELQRRTDSLTIKVYNAGRSADATPEHIAMLSHRIIHLQPDAIIVFAGLNDFVKSVQGYDYLHLRNRDNEEDKYDWLFSLQLTRRTYNAVKRQSIEEQRQLIKFETDYSKLVKIQNDVPISASEPNADPSPYRVNLNSITGICAMNDIPLFFMTNATTWNSHDDDRVTQFQWMLLCNGNHYNAQYMDDGLNSFNDVMREVSVAHKIPLLDLAKTLPKSTAYFYDDCHFNNNGAETSGRKLADLVGAQFKIENSDR